MQYIHAMGYIIKYTKYNNLETQQQWIASIGPGFEVYTVNIFPAMSSTRGTHFIQNLNHEIKYELNE